MKYNVIVFKPYANDIYETMSVDVENESEAKRKVQSKIDAKNRVGITEYRDAKIVRVVAPK